MFSIFARDKSPDVHFLCDLSSLFSWIDFSLWLWYQAGKYCVFKIFAPLTLIFGCEVDAVLGDASIQDDDDDAGRKEDTSTVVSLV